MATRALAKQLGLIETIKVGSDVTTQHTNQKYDFLYVLDFESTCWDTKDSNRRAPEIIEFSVVLYDVRKNKIADEFQQYVMPTEAPKLSEFCKRFSGISQRQVDNGVPLGTCLMLCMNWIKKHVETYNLLLSIGSEFVADRNLCVFVTWTDWDLGTCLANECKRKHLKKPSVFNEWVDLKALYIEYYKRRPKGLLGALTELGLTFEGQEHCGLHDARNTAKLAAKLMSDGVSLFVTKTI